MIAAQIDKNGSLDVVWARSDADIIAHGEKYCDYEGHLPETERLTLPNLAFMQATVAQAKVAAAQAVEYENQRAVAATDYAHAIAEAKALLKEALIELRHKYRKNRARLQEWGVATKAGRRQDVVFITLQGDKGWVTLLHTYVTQEQGLPEADRIAEPPLARLTALDEIIQKALALRTGGATERSIGVQQRTAVSQYLLDLLQAAGLLLCVTRYHSTVSEDLSRWGYTVIGKPPKPPKTPKPDAPPAPEPPTS